MRSWAAHHLATSCKILYLKVSWRSEAVKMHWNDECCQISWENVTIQVESMRAKLYRSVINSENITNSWISNCIDDIPRSTPLAVSTGVDNASNTYSFSNQISHDYTVEEVSFTINPWYLFSQNSKILCSNVKWATYRVSTSSGSQNLRLF